MRKKLPSEATDEEVRAEVERLRERRREADRLSAPLFFEQFYGITVIYEAPASADDIRPFSRTKN